MCGIVGFCGKENALPHLLDGLEKLEYRGYDSAGVAILSLKSNDVKSDKSESAKIESVKAKGRLDNLKKQLNAGLSGSVGIGHTRWATHGAPNDSNSHPHLSRSGRFAVVHNGIIENYAEIKDFLIQRSFSFASETDTEVIAHLMEYYYRGDAVDAIIKAAQRLHGSYALAILCVDCTDTMFAMRKESPLVVGVGAKNGMFAASDMTALLSHTRDFIFPESGEIAIINQDSVKVINFNREIIEKKIIHADWPEDAAKKNGFEHFMLKEIYEQPRAIADTLSELDRRLNGLTLKTADTSIRSNNSDLSNGLDTLKNAETLSIIACGSAYHAGIAARYFIEKLCRIPVECEMASEFRYKNPIIRQGTLGLAISQSGETADTIAALNEAKKSVKTLSVVNVLGSSIARLSDEVVYTLAGPEIAVATTKGYISQVAALYRIGLHLCRQRLIQGKECGLDFFNYPQISKKTDKINSQFSADLKNDTSQFINENSKNSGLSIPQNIHSFSTEHKSVQNLSSPYAPFSGVKTDISQTNGEKTMDEGLKNQLKKLNSLEEELRRLPQDVKNLLGQKEIFQQLSSRFSFISSAFFIGRGIDYAIAMEGALKLKEISYIHAQSYPAGELKHGTISLIEQDSLVVAISTDPRLYEKTISNIREVQSRGAVVLAITCFDEVAAAANYHAKIEAGINAPMIAAVSLQLFSYYVALARGCDIDKPRNLAKSVTVE